MVVIVIVVVVFVSCCWGGNGKSDKSRNGRDLRTSTLICDGAGMEGV